MNPLATHRHTAGYKRRIANATSLLTQAAQLGDGYVAVSGGKDSTALAILTAQHLGPSWALVWFDSGLELPDTRPYLQTMADTLGMPLHIINADPDALTLLQQGGWFDHDAPDRPDPQGFHDALITVPSRKARDLYGPVYLMGLRKGESWGRHMRILTTGGIWDGPDGGVAAAPIGWLTDDDVRALIDTQPFGPHPAYTAMDQLGIPRRDQRVGLAVDTNALTQGRATFLQHTYPELWATLCQHLPRIREYA